MSSGSPHSDADRAPGGRLRLAAALGGAGMLAVGMGAGVLQAHGQDGAPVAPGAEALSGQDPASAPAAAPTTTTTSTTSTATTAPAASTTSTPAPAPAPEPAAQAPAPVEEHEHEHAPAAAPEPKPASEPVAEPAAADARPAEQHPEPAAEPQPEAAAEEAEAAEAEKDDAVPECRRSDEEVLTIQGAEEDAEAPVEIKCEKPRRARAKAKAKADRRSEAERRERRAPSAEREAAPQQPAGPALRNEGGVPTVANPTTSLATPGPAPIGVPNFFIDKFRIPPFLLPIYQAAGTEHGIRWEVLAAINEIETDYGRNLNVSSAGALGWMQFMPATWKAYGVDANGDGRKDPYNPVDAIFAAARYLEAAGGHDDLRKAIFAYNHADWYVDSVLMRARIVGGMPVDLVGSLTGLTEGRFPVDAKARYADDLLEQQAERRAARRAGQVALPVEGDASRRGIDIFAGKGSPAVATHDGRVVGKGWDERLGNFVRIRDAHGNEYTYGRLQSLERHHPVAKGGAKRGEHRHSDAHDAEPARTSVTGAAGKERLFAHPRRRRAYAAGGDEQVVEPATTGDEGYANDLLDLPADKIVWKRLKPGSQIVAGTVLGRIGRTTEDREAHLRFEIRPAGRGAPRIDPKPILDGWQLLETTEIYRANRKNPFHGEDAKTPTIGQILLMTKDALQRRVLSNPRIVLHEGGDLDIRSGRIDRRVLALLEFLAANGLKPTVSSLYREGSITTSGNLSHHATGTAVDISAVNDTPVIGNQGAGSITDIAVRRLLTLQGAMRPDQIITLMTYPGASNTIAMGDHHDHIHVGYSPVGSDARTGKAINAQLKPGQWFRVIDRLNEIENPVVRKGISPAAIKVTPKRRPR